MEPFDLTPDPKVLLALTHTPMQPLDALCELIDNAIDSFQAGRLRGTPIPSPLVAISLPRPSDLKAGAGAIAIRDNGPGLSREQAEQALRAGFSGNNPYDSLGLFGMGFNISTGKLGRVTKFVTARAEDAEALEVVVDLEHIRQSRSFKVPTTSIPKPPSFASGTLVEIQGWWPEGNPNSGFVKKLVQYGMPRVREEIGRRYATILRGKQVNIVVNDEPCQPFEHCAWADTRYVERRGSGRIPAVLRFDELIGTQKRCGSCTALVDAALGTCQVCGSASLRTIEERIRGWVGVQRFDDPTEFGIDLIRNGRAVRISEKAAFFDFTDEFKKTIKDYPADGTLGRLIGEVHLNHVPVDFLKQDFQRSSPEWLRAVAFLRGESSLQPSQPGADKNSSPVYRLYQGYRRVRRCGRADMYMGVWDVANEEPRRISRDIEREYLDKFRRRLPGFYDDAEWWKLVEQAERRPLEELVECGVCAAQNLKGHDACISCGAVLIGKECVNPDCKKTIPLSAASCPHCGISQVPELVQPWACNVCGATNSEIVSECTECGAPLGTLHPLERERLLLQSHKVDELCLPACTIPLADGTNSAPIDVEVYSMKEAILPRPGMKPLPLYAIKSPDRIEIFLDLNHIVFRAFRIPPEQFIASEVALVLYDANRRLSGRQNTGIHTLSTLAWQIVQSRWASRLEDSAERVRADIGSFFSSVRERLPAVLDGKWEDVYDDLDDGQKRHLVDTMLGRNIDLMTLPEARVSGKYLHFVDDATIVGLVREYPGLFFDGRVWAVTWELMGDLSAHIVDDVRARTHALYLNCLDDLVGFARYQQPDNVVTQRARASLRFLQQKLAG